MKRAMICGMTALLLVIPAASWAWGPTTQLTIVTNALHLISKDSNIPLVRLEKDLRAGASISMEMLMELYPDMAADPIRAVESEMYLLKAVQGRKIDGYFVYRLGALGKLVAEATSPMRDASLAYRNVYYADVEKNIANTTLQSKPRQTVEPKSYLGRLLTDSITRDDMILKEYQGGKGYEGVAATTLSDSATLSVNAVADIWYTVLMGTALAGNVSEAQLQKYVLDAYAYFIRRGNTRELDDVSERLNQLTPLTTDMRAKIGDLYLEAELSDRAMTEYRAVLDQDPSRRDVAEKIANYYVKTGEKAMEDQKLENALDGFTTAAQANPLHPTAEGLKIQAQELIVERDRRRAASQDALDRASKFQTLAEEETLKDRYAEAISLLRQADATYQEVPEEFPVEYQQRTRGQKTVQYRIQELQGQIMEHAQIFSGSGDAQSMRQWAQTGGKDLEAQALQALINKSYAGAMSALEGRLQSSMAVQ